MTSKVPSFAGKKRHLPMSDMMKSNLYTMQVASKNDTRQAIGAAYYKPSEVTRILRARLIMEEALETIKGLGVKVDFDASMGDVQKLEMECLIFQAVGTYNEEEAIDGVCDTIYVCLGTLAVMGVPDLPHLAEVSCANNQKFPGGVAITDPTGKFQKPAGWLPPDHCAVKEQVLDMLNDKGVLGTYTLAESAEILVTEAK